MRDDRTATETTLRTPENCPSNGVHPRKLDANSVAQHLTALRFFYNKTLKRNLSVEETPYPKRPIRLPDVLSQEEVERLIDSANNRLHRVWLLTLYATGVRREELVQLKVSDVDRKSTRLNSSHLGI